MISQQSALSELCLHINVTFSILPQFATTTTGS